MVGERTRSVILFRLRARARKAANPIISRRKSRRGLPQGHLVDPPRTGRRRRPASSDSAVLLALDEPTGQSVRPGPPPLGRSPLAPSGDGGGGADLGDPGGRSLRSELDEGPMRRAECPKLANRNVCMHIPRRVARLWTSPVDDLSVARAGGAGSGFRAALAPRRGDHCLNY